MSSSVDTFITRRQKSRGSGRSNYGLFLFELCGILGVNCPDPAGGQNALNDYVIDRAFTRIDKDGVATTVYLDL